MAHTLDGPRRSPAHGKAGHLVVFLHGYGANGDDLIGLAPHWQGLLPDAAFVSPNAPDPCGAGGPGFQWFPLARIDPHDMAKGLASVAPVVDAFLDAELERAGLGPEQLALVGFSQGTMLALHVGLRRKVPPAAIIGFSGMLAAEEAPQPATEGRPPILLTHGSADQVIPEAMMFYTAGALGAAGLPVQWHRAPGMGHGIDETGLLLAGLFLADAFAGRLSSQGPLCCLPKK